MKKILLPFFTLILCAHHYNPLIASDPNKQHSPRNFVKIPSQEDIKQITDTNTLGSLITKLTGSYDAAEDILKNKDQKGRHQARAHQQALIDAGCQIYRQSEFLKNNAKK